MRTMFHEGDRQHLFGRLRRLDLNRPPRWGRMTARQVPPHLLDQMRVTMGEVTVDRIPGPMRYSPLREAALYWLPWPKGIKGPSQMFTTLPTDWAADLDALVTIVERFVQRGPAGSWPEHPAFGRMNGRDWGVLCYRHFAHHISQFGG